MSNDFDRDAYNEWMEEVDKEVWRLLNLSVHDLSDWLSADAFLDDIPPEDAAVEAIMADDLASGVYLKIYGSLR